MNWIKNLALICFSALLPVGVFLCIDLAIGFSRTDFSATKCETCDMNDSFEGGWYELKPNFDEHLFFWLGKMSYRVITDENRYRVGPGEKKECSDGCTDLLFLGDSFTFGLNGNWEDTYVGMVEANSSGFNVINGGNGSYSVTPYNYIYKRYLRTRTSERPHLVVIAVDVGDVLDEASGWEAGPDHPRRQAWALEDLMRKRAEGRITTGHVHTNHMYPYRAYLPYSHSIYGYIKHVFLNDVAYLHDDMSAYTYKDWELLDQSYTPDGFLPLGVAGGIAKVGSGLKQLLKEIEKHNGEAIFLIYPWPQQIEFADTHFDWPEFIQTICDEESCEGVVNLFPVMREYKHRHPNDWYTDLFVIGDFHYETRGNEIIAEQLLRYLDAKRSDTRDSEISH